MSRSDAPPTGAISNEVPVQTRHRPEQHQGGTPVAGKDPLVLVLTADENFAMPLAVTLYSALENLRPHSQVLVYIIDGGITPASKQRLKALLHFAHVEVCVEYITPASTRLDAYRLKAEKRFTRSVFSRILISELLPERLEKALYLDSDMVVEADLMQLWQTDVGNRAALAVRDFDIPYVSSRPRGLYNWREMGFEPDVPYFNSGLMVLNLTRWRAEQIGGKILDYLAQHADNFKVQGNQEGFNAVLAHEWGELDLRWNLIHSIYDDDRFDRSEYKEEVRPIRRALIRNPYIIHFTASKKPWHPDCIHPARSRFFHYLRRSGWFSPSEYFRWRIHLLPRQTGTRWLYLARVKSRPYRHWTRRTAPAPTPEEHAAHAARQLPVR